MKKLLQISAFLLAAVFLMPLAAVELSAKTEQTSSSSFSEEAQQKALPEPVTQEAPLLMKSPSATDRQQTVTLLTEGTVRELSMHDYLVGVLASEMPASFPEEALKAQAIAARTYAFYKKSLYAEETEVHRGAQLCDDPGHCEAFTDLETKAEDLWGDSAELYRDRIESAVDATDGLILTYQEEPIAAVFCAASGEITENAQDIWGTALPYLVSVESPGGQECAKYLGEVNISQKDFTEAVKARHPEADFSASPGEWFQELRRSEAGSVLSAKVGGIIMDGKELRQLVGLNSANFTVSLEDERMVFHTVGYGHGVGMSQYGARYMALAGKNCEEILLHYYPGAVLETGKTDFE